MEFCWRLVVGLLCEIECLVCRGYFLAWSDDTVMYIFSWLLLLRPCNRALRVFYAEVRKWGLLRGTRGWELVSTAGESSPLQMDFHTILFARLHHALEILLSDVTVARPIGTEVEEALPPSQCQCCRVTWSCCATYKNLFLPLIFHLTRFHRLGSWPDVADKTLRMQYVEEARKLFRSFCLTLISYPVATRQNSASQCQVLLSFMNWIHSSTSFVWVVHREHVVYNIFPAVAVNRNGRFPDDSAWMDVLGTERRHHS